MKFWPGAANHLVVTDNRMPTENGTQLVRHITREHKNLHVVMVSGYLSNDDIRQLIRDGVGGVFIKPLNIFQLLKRAAQLLEEREETPKEKTQDKEKRSDNHAQKLKSFAGASSALAQKFARQVISLRSFSSNLIVSGQAGSDFKAICEDLAEGPGETLFILDPAELDKPEVLASRLGGLAGNGRAGRLTIAFQQLEQIDAKRAEAIFSIARVRPPFDNIGQGTRFIFCLRENLDQMFDAGRIDENLYLFMGTMELKLPSLGELLEDLPGIARAILEQRQPPCRLDEEGAALLASMDWPGDMAQLCKVLADAATSCSGQSIGADLLRDAREGHLSSPVLEPETSSGGLREHLLRCRDSYVKAMGIILDGDATAAQLALEISKESLRRILASGQGQP